MYQFKLADLGEGIAEVEVVEWLVQEGDALQEDQPVVAVQTDKAALEISSPKAGRVHRVCCKAGEIIPVGQVLIEIETGEEGSAAVSPAVASQTAPRPAPRSHDVVTPPPQILDRKQPPSMPPRPSARPLRAAPTPRQMAEAVPAVRELAKQMGIDIEQVTGTGPDGRVMRRDIEAFSAGAKKDGSARVVAHPTSGDEVRDEADWTRQPLRGVRRVIAERMVRSKTLIPHYTFVDEVDVTLLESRRKALAECSGQQVISPLAFVAQAALCVLPRFPEMNACLDEETGEIILKQRIHLGIAVATDDGLMVPVIRNAPGRGVAELAAAIHDLSERARAKKLDPAELKGATFTITSLGKLGGVMATPIINYPASAILGVHAIRTLPRYVGSEVKPRQIMNLAVSLDHRLVDGFEGARFVQQVKEILEEARFPEFA